MNVWMRLDKLFVIVITIFLLSFFFFQIFFIGNLKPYGF